MKKKILLVEDQEAMRKALGDELGIEGFDVIEAGDGELGLQKALNEHPDLIMLDIMLPKMNGMVVLKSLRADAWGASVPVILLTELEADDKIMHGIVQNEPSFYLVKTKWNLSQIVQKIKETLEAQSK